MLIGYNIAAICRPHLRMLSHQVEILLIILAALVALPGTWCGVLWFLAQLGGWSKLAKYYRSDIAVEGGTHRKCSGKVGIVSYKSCLILTFCDSGIRVAVTLPFRIAHPPLFIPWVDIHDVREKKMMLGLSFLQANVGSPTVARLSLPIWVGEYFPPQVIHAGLPGGR